MDYPNKSKDFFGNVKSVRETLFAVCSTPINVYPSCFFSVKYWGRSSCHTYM